MNGSKKERDETLPPNWPNEWPQNLEEFVELLKSDEFLNELEDHGMYLRFNDKEGTVRIIKKRDLNGG